MNSNLQCSIDLSKIENMKFPVSDCIIIGAGAAGLFCAGLISKQGKSVSLLEHNSQPGKKIRISGGGRCNFTNRIVKAQHFISDNPHYAVSALSRYTPDDFIRLIESYNISYHEKTLGQLFCDGSSQQVIDMLLSECDSNYTDISYGVLINSVSRNELFHVETNKGIFSARHLIIATGGLSIPSLGASNFGYTLAKQFGHSIIDTRPALVPLTIEKEEFPCANIAGVSLPIEASTMNGPIFRESMLFTHKGLSGPAILQASSYISSKSPIKINVLPTLDECSLEDVSPKSEWKTLLGQYVPKRFADLWTETHNQTDTIGHYGNKRIQSFLDELRDWSPIIQGNEGYAKAEVTAGGINTKELSSKTMMSNIVPNLYFIGEVVDVTGHLGGYNFQWAWSSAHAVAQSLMDHHG